MRPPEIEDSSREEREKCIHEMFKCIGDCDSCGICAVYKGKSPEAVYEDYIEGRRSFLEISMKYR